MISFMLDKSSQDFSYPFQFLFSSVFYFYLHIRKFFIYICFRTLRSPTPVIPTVATPPARPGSSRLLLPSVSTAAPNPPHPASAPTHPPPRPRPRPPPILPLLHPWWRATDPAPPPQWAIISTSTRPPSPPCRPGPRRRPITPATARIALGVPSWSTNHAWKKWRAEKRREKIGIAKSHRTRRQKFFHPSLKIPAWMKIITWGCSSPVAAMSFFFPHKISRLFLICN